MAGDASKIGGNGFLPAYERAARRLFARIERSCAAEQPWPLRVRDALRAALELFAADPELGCVLVFEAYAEGPEAQARHEETIARLTGLLRHGREEEDAPPMPEHVEEGLIGGLAFIVGRPLRDDRPADLLDLAPELTALILTPYLGRAEAERVAGIAPA
jgi:hypothetical protein